MKANYTKAYNIIRGYEGGNVDDPKDPGGRTSRGVTQRVYSAYRISRKKPTQDVYKATEAEVSEIYRLQYWSVNLCDQLPSGIDIVVFDTAVNSGGKRAMKILQASLNRVANGRLLVDGGVGMITVQAALNAPDHDSVVLEFGRKRQAFYRALSTWKYYGKGWTRRNDNVTKIGTAWATGTVGPQPVKMPLSLAAKMDVPDDTGKVMNAKAKDADLPGEIQGGNTLTVGGVAGGGGIEGAQATLQEQSGMLQQFAYYIEWLQYVLFALAIVGIGLSIWAYMRNRKLKRINDAIDSVEIDI